MQLMFAVAGFRLSVVVFLGSPQFYELFYGLYTAFLWYADVVLLQWPALNFELFLDKL